MAFGEVFKVHSAYVDQKEFDCRVSPRWLSRVVGFPVTFASAVRRQLSSFGSFASFWAGSFAFCRSSSSRSFASAFSFCSRARFSSSSFRATSFRGSGVFVLHQVPAVF